MSREEITFEDCRACGAKCCQHVAMHIEKPACKRDYDNIRWFLMHENVSVFQDHEGDWLVEFKTRCSHLRKDNGCDNYSSRPNVCRDYPPVDMPCEYDSDDPTYKIRFETSRQFEKWLEKRGKDWKLKKMKP
jgi:Fe-S-cluster containining protein